MTIRVGSSSSSVPGTFEPSSSTVVVTTDALANICAEIGASLDEQQQTSREARRASQAARHEDQQRQVAKLRDAATFQMAAGIVQGSMTIASAAVKGIGVGVRADAPAATGQVTSAGAQTGVDPGWACGADAVSGVGQMTSGILGAESQARQADATSAEHSAQEESERAQGQGEDAQRSLGQRDRATDVMRQVLDARRQSEQAALRG